MDSNYLNVYALGLVALYKKKIQEVTFRECGKRNKNGREPIFDYLGTLMNAGPFENGIFNII